MVPIDICLQRRVIYALFVPIFIKHLWLLKLNIFSILSGTSCYHRLELQILQLLALQKTDYGLFCFMWMVTQWSNLIFWSFLDVSVVVFVDVLTFPSIALCRTYLSTNHKTFRTYFIVWWALIWAVLSFFFLLTAF